MSYLPGLQPPPTAHARRDDRATSHEAAASLSSDTLTEIQARILSLFCRHGDMDDITLVARYTDAYGPTRESTIRTRRAELVADGRVVSVGSTTGASGRRMTVWARR